MNFNKMNWKRKKRIQKFIEKLPNPYKVNYWFQKRTTIKNGLPESYVSRIIDQGALHLDSEILSKGAVLEIGTGWFPIIPILYFLHGYDKITTWDVNNLTSLDSIQKTVEAIQKHHKKKNLKIQFPDIDEKRLQKFLAIEKVSHSTLTELNIEHVISDMSALVKRTNFLQIISNNTFQFIPEKELQLFFKKAPDLLLENGTMSIHIDFTDEYSHSDQSNHKLNYLRYSDKEWRKIATKLYNPNRLRFDQVKSFISNELIITDEQKELHSEQTISSAIIHESFKNHDIETAHVWWKMKRKI